MIDFLDLVNNDLGVERETDALGITDALTFGEDLGLLRMWVETLAFVRDLKDFDVDTFSSDLAGHFHDPRVRAAYAEAAGPGRQVAFVTRETFSGTGDGFDRLGPALAKRFPLHLRDGLVELGLCLDIVAARRPLCEESDADDDRTLN